MGDDLNLHELSMNVIYCFTICVKRKLHVCAILPFFVILSEKSAHFWAISCEIPKITGIEQKQNFIIQN